MQPIREESLDLTRLAELLQKEEQRNPVASAEDWEQARAGRKAFSAQVAALRRRIEALPRLADESLVKWSRQMLRISNLGFLIVDTTGTKEGSDILRLYLADRDGNALFDEIVKPERFPGNANTTYTGLSAAQIQAVPPLSTVWPNFLSVLDAHVIISYGWDFVSRQLTENARHYRLEPPTLIGECLLTRAKEYYGVSDYLRLSSICEWIHHPLPFTAPAPLRAKAQLAFLLAMSQGIMRLGDEEIDEHPF